MIKRPPMRIVDPQGNTVAGFDHHGKPVAYDFFKAGAISTRRENPWRYYYAAQDTNDLLPVAGWQQMMSSGRFLFANLPMIRAALLEEARFSFPLISRYIGEDQVFGELAGEWLWDWKRCNNLRGLPYDQHTNSRIRMLGYKVDGDIGTQYTWDPDTGYPKLQYVRAHRIGGGDIGGETTWPSGPIKTGPYKGKTLYNGCVVDDYDRTIAFLLPGKKRGEEQWVDARNFMLLFRPDYSDQWRGLSHLVATIPSSAEFKRLREYELRAQQIQASYAVAIKNQSGFTDEGREDIIHGDRQVDQGAQASVTTQTLNDGLALYFKSGTGAGLEMLRPDRPGADAQAFEDRVVRHALIGMEWDPDFLLALKEPGGAWARTILQKINFCIANNVRTEAMAQRREDWYAINKAIELKLLPAPKDGDTWSWEYQLAAPQITADSGNDLAAIRENYLLGLTTLQDWCRRSGDGWKDHRGQRQTEVVDLLNRAKAIKELFPELSLLDCINLLERRNNGNTSPTVKPGAPPAAAPPATPPKK